MTLMKRKDTEIKRGCTRSHLVESSLWNKLLTRKTDCGMNEPQLEESVTYGDPECTGLAQSA